MRDFINDTAVDVISTDYKVTKREVVSSDKSPGSWRSLSPEDFALVTDYSFLFKGDNNEKD